MLVCALRKNNPFSLVELLIVVAIVLILISIAQPALQKAIDNALLTKCLNTLHKNGLGLTLYADDNDTDLPDSNASIAPYWGVDTTYYIERGGSEVKHHPYGLAVLYDESEYMSAPQDLYCPFWRHPYRNYQEIDVAGRDPHWGNRHFGGYPIGGSSRVSIENNGPMTHIGISYYYRASLGPLGNRKPSIRLDTPGTVITTDQFNRREALWGAAFGHPNSYSALYLDGSARYFKDDGHNWMRFQQPCPDNRADDDIHSCKQMSHGIIGSWNWKRIDDLIKAFFEDSERF